MYPRWIWKFIDLGCVDERIPICNNQHQSWNTYTIIRLINNYLTHYVNYPLTSCTKLYKYLLVVMIVYIDISLINVVKNRNKNFIFQRVSPNNYTVIFQDCFSTYFLIFYIYTESIFVYWTICFEIIFMQYLFYCT